MITPIAAKLSQIALQPWIEMFVTEWREGELARINNTLSGAERKAALCQLLDQETQLLASIGRHKIEADSENRQRFIKDFLEKVRQL